MPQMSDVIARMELASLIRVTRNGAVEKAFGLGWLVEADGALSFKTPHTDADGADEIKQVGHSLEICRNLVQHFGLSDDDMNDEEHDLRGDKPNALDAIERALLYGDQ